MQVRTAVLGHESKLQMPEHNESLTHLLELELFMFLLPNEFLCAKKNCVSKSANQSAVALADSCKTRALFSGTWRSAKGRLFFLMEKT